MNRRHFLLGGLGLLGAGLGYGASRWWPDGNQWRNPCLSKMPPDLANHPMVQAAWDGLDPKQVLDTHVHIAGVGDFGGGIWVNPAMDSLWHPILYAQKRVFLDAACANGDRAEMFGVDSTYLDRLLEQANAFPAGAGFLLYAMDAYVDADGELDEKRTTIFVNNTYVRNMANAWPERFAWAASVHPYRQDAISMLEQQIQDGARAIKWLPSAMGIDPASPRCDEFYAVLAKHDLPLIVHVGTELSVDGADGQQDNNNPLRLRRPLQAGVRVVAAHCASLGSDLDLDDGGKRSVSSFELFARMMNEPTGKNLYGDLSAIPQLHRYRVLPTLLEQTEWHGRLLNGSDYPLPGIVPLYLLKELVRANLLSETDAGVLNDIRKYNALLFDFLLKRRLRWKGVAFPAGCFETRRFFFKP